MLHHVVEQVLERARVVHGEQLVVQTGSASTLASGLGDFGGHDEIVGQPLLFQLGRFGFHAVEVAFAGTCPQSAGLTFTARARDFRRLLFGWLIFAAGTVSGSGFRHKSLDFFTGFCRGFSFA